MRSSQWRDSLQRKQAGEGEGTANAIGETPQAYQENENIFPNSNVSTSAQDVEEALLYLDVLFDESEENDSNMNVDDRVNHFPHLYSFARFREDLLALQLTPQPCEEQENFFLTSSSLPSPPCDFKVVRLAKPVQDHPFFGTHIPDAPKIIALRVFDLLDSPSFYSLSLVSSLWARASMDEALWEEVPKH